MRTALVSAHTLCCSNPEMTVNFVFFTVLRLPPGLEAVVGEGGDHVLNRVAGWVGVLIVHLRGAAHEAFLVLLIDKLGK